jgi:hypothetical protein
VNGHSAQLSDQLYDQHDACRYGAELQQCADASGLLLTQLFACQLLV